MDINHLSQPDRIKASQDNQPAPLYRASNPVDTSSDARDIFSPEGTTINKDPFVLQQDPGISDGHRAGDGILKTITDESFRDEAAGGADHSAVAQVPVILIESEGNQAGTDVPAFVTMDGAQGHHGYSQVLRCAARIDACQEIFEVIQHTYLSDREGDTVASFFKTALESDDPVLKRLRQRIIYLEKSDMKEITRGHDPALFFQRYAEYIEGNGALYDKAAGENLGRLEKETKSGMINECTLRSLTHFIHSLHNEMTSMPTNQDRPSLEKILIDCCTLLDRWRDNGQIELRIKGKTVPNGFPLPSEMVKNGRVPINGSVIDLAEYPPPCFSDEVISEKQSLMDALSRKDTDIQKELGHLKKIGEDDPEKAAAIVEAMIGDISPQNYKSGVRQESIGTMLGNARQNPWLEELIAPHMERIKGFASENHHRGRDSLYDKILIDIYEALMSGFPEEIDEEFLRKGVAPLLVSDDIRAVKGASGLLKQIWKEHPELVGPAVDEVVSDYGRVFLSHACWNVLIDAVKQFGWLPDDRQQEMIASRLVSIGEANFSTSRNYGELDTDYKGAIRLISSIREKNPDLFRSERIPDGYGRMVSIDEAAIRLVLQDPAVKNTFGYLYPENDSDTAVEPESAYSGSREQAFIDQVFKRAQEILPETGSHHKVSQDGAIALTTLWNLPLSKDQNQWLEKTLGNVIYTHSPSMQSSLYMLRMDEADQQASSLTSGELSAREVLKTSLKIIVLSYCFSNEPFHVQDFYQSRWDAIKDGLARISDTEELHECLSGLLSDFKDAYASHSQSIKDFTPFEFAGIHLLLSFGDEATVDLLASILGAEAKENDILNSGGAERGIVYTLIRQACTDINNKKLENGKLKRTEREELIAENERIWSNTELQERNIHKIKSYQAFAKGLAASGSGLADMPAFFRNHQTAYQLYLTLAGERETDEEIAPSWAHFREILKFVGGETKFNDAIAMYRYVEKMVASGYDREICLRHAFECYLNRRDYKEYPIKTDESLSQSILDIDGEVIDFNGVRLQTRD